MIYVNSKWTYKETIKHIKILKDEYQHGLSSFSVWEAKKWADFIVSTRNQFYSLNLMEWQIDNLWKYMNGYISFEMLERSSLRYK